MSRLPHHRSSSLTSSMLFAIALILTQGCSKASSHAQEALTEPRVETPARPAAAKATATAAPATATSATAAAAPHTQADFDRIRLGWLLRHSVQTAQKANTQEIPVDPNIIDFLNHVCLYQARQAKAPAPATVADEGRRLYEAGYDNPIFLRCYGEVLGDCKKTTESCDVETQALMKFQNPASSEINVFLASAQLAAAMRAQHGKFYSEALTVQRAALRKLASAIAGGAFTAAESQLAWRMLRDNAGAAGVASPWTDAWNDLKGKRIDAWLMLMIQGSAELEAALAWAAGGPEASRNFESQRAIGEHLREARIALTGAWKLSPERPEAAAEMIRVAALESKPPAGETPQAWYERAIAAQSDYRPAQEALAQAKSGTLVKGEEPAAVASATPQATATPVAPKATATPQATVAPVAPKAATTPQPSPTTTPAPTPAPTPASPVATPAPAAVAAASTPAPAPPAAADQAIEGVVTSEPVPPTGAGVKTPALTPKPAQAAALSMPAATPAPSVSTPAPPVATPAPAPAGKVRAVAARAMPVSPNDPPLIQALERNDAAGANQLIRAKADLNVADRDGLKPLHLATAQRLTETMRLLLERNTDVNGKTPLGETPLHIACKNGAIECVGLLLDNGANVNLPSPEGWTPLDMAVQKKYENIVALLLDRGAKVNAAGSKGVPPLMIAVQAGYTEIARKLLDLGADPNATPFPPATPLHEAIRLNHPEIAINLIDLGAKVNAPDARNRAALHMAVERNLPTVAAKLLDTGALPDARDGENKTALQLAIERGDAAMVQLLLEHRASARIPAADGTSTMLDLAQKKGNAQIIQLISARMAKYATQKKPAGATAAPSAPATSAAPAVPAVPATK